MDENQERDYQEEAHNARILATGDGEGVTSWKEGDRVSVPPPQREAWITGTVVKNDPHGPMWPRTIRVVYDVPFPLDLNSGVDATLAWAWYHPDAIEPLEE